MQSFDRSRPFEERRLPKTLLIRLLRLRLCLLFFFTLAPQAAAHDPFELTTTGDVSPAGMALVTTATRGCAAALLDPRSARPAAFASDELSRLAPQLESAAARLFDVAQSGRRLDVRSAKVELTVEAEVKFTVVYAAPAVGPLAIGARHVRALGPGYASALTLTQNEAGAVLGTAVFTSDAPELVVQVLGPATPPSSGDDRNAARIGFARTFMLGAEHILLGFDHLLFLAGLLIA